MNDCSPIGSTYEWQPPSGELAKLPAESKLFATGRGALLAACRQIAPNANIWLPSYFCGDVADALAKGGLDVKTYDDLPTLREPEWPTLTPRPGDVVVAVNLFGIRHAEPWKKWQLTNRDIHLVEDHTHDPLSNWAMRSTADYAIASLRKTVPIPDGAVLWSPKNHSLPSPSGTDFSPAAAYALAGMILKKSYLGASAADEQLYKEMRICQQRGEELLAIAGDLPISAWSREFLSFGLSADLRRRREHNTRQFLATLERAPGLDGLVPMYNEWPPGHCPFNPMLLFETHELREVCRHNLIRQQVFVPVHWPVSKRMTPRAADLARRALTIPLDFRCGADQHGRIISILQGCLAESRAACQAA